MPHQKPELDSLAATLHAEAILRGELPAALIVFQAEPDPPGKVIANR